MKFFFLIALISVSACSGKKRVPFDQKLKDLQFAQAQARAQAEAQKVPERSSKRNLGRAGILCQAITQDGNKEIFLVPMRREESDRVSYDFFELAPTGELKSLGIELDGFLFYHFEGKYVKNKDGSITDLVKGTAISRLESSGTTVYSVQFLIDDSPDRGVSVQATLESKKGRGNVQRSELAQITSCVKTAL
jgi:hypothetical protein